MPEMATNKQSRPRWFTLAELIVVVTILAVLSALALIAFSLYSQDAKEAAVKSDVRSVLTAIVSESAISDTNPRRYVVNDGSAMLATGTVAYVDGVQHALTGGSYGTEGTNYSAWTPDWNVLKFKPKTVSVGALDVPLPATAQWWSRWTSFLQVAGISPATWMASVAWTFPNPTPSQASSGATPGLVKNPNGNDALVDGVTAHRQGGGAGGWAGNQGYWVFHLPNYFPEESNPNPNNRLWTVVVDGWYQAACPSWGIVVPAAPANWSASAYPQISNDLARWPFRFSLEHGSNPADVYPIAPYGYFSDTYCLPATEAEYLAQIEDVFGSNDCDGSGTRCTDRHDNPYLIPKGTDWASDGLVFSSGWVEVGWNWVTSPKPVNVTLGWVTYTIQSVGRESQWMAANGSCNYQYYFSQSRVVLAENSHHWILPNFPVYDCSQDTWPGPGPLAYSIDMCVLADRNSSVCKNLP